MADELGEEIEAINAIYGPETLQATEKKEVFLFDLRALGHIPSLRISFSESYPEQRPLILGSQTSLGEKGHSVQVVGLARNVLERVFVPGTVVLFDFAEELQRLVSEEDEQQSGQWASRKECSEAQQSYSSKDESAELVQNHGQPQTKGQPPKPFANGEKAKGDSNSESIYHCVFYFHHIYSKTKIKSMHAMANTYNLTGIMKTSRPGFLYARNLRATNEDILISPKGSLENFVREVKQMRWQEVQLKYLDRVREAGGKNDATPRGDVSPQRPGFEQIETMSGFSTWMREHSLGDLLKESVLR